MNNYADLKTTAHKITQDVVMYTHKIWFVKVYVFCFFVFVVLVER